MLLSNPHQIASYLYASSSKAREPCSHAHQREEEKSSCFLFWFFSLNGLKSNEWVKNFFRELWEIRGIDKLIKQRLEEPRIPIMNNECFPSCRLKLLMSLCGSAKLGRCSAFTFSCPERNPPLLNNLHWILCSLREERRCYLETGLLLLCQMSAAAGNRSHLQKEIKII